MLAVEIMQLAPERVTRLALLDTGMRGQNEAERAIRAARIRLTEQGHFELVLGLQLARFIPAYRLPDQALIDEVVAMCGEIGVEIYRRQEALAAIRADRRPDLPRIACPTVISVRPRRRRDAALPVGGDRRRDRGQRAHGGRAVRAPRHTGEARRDERGADEVARPSYRMTFLSRSAAISLACSPATSLST